MLGRRGSKECRDLCLKGFRVRLHLSWFNSHFYTVDWMIGDVRMCGRNMDICSSMSVRKQNDSFCSLQSCSAMATSFREELLRHHGSTSHKWQNGGNQPCQKPYCPCWEPRRNALHCFALWAVNMVLQQSHCRIAIEASDGRIRRIAKDGSVLSDSKSMGFHTATFTISAGDLWPSNRRHSRIGRRLTP